MVNGVKLNDYVDNSDDNTVWSPITSEEDKKEFSYHIEEVKRAFESGTKKEKGDSLETLMTFIFERLSCAIVEHDVLISDNQIDHLIDFIEGLTPTFIKDHFGLRIIGESKNHAESISGREVTNLSDLLEFREAKSGIFSSVKSFSKRGKSFWTYGEGTRRKIFLRKRQTIIGFSLKELESLTENNFYTMLKTKFGCLSDEINDNLSDVDDSVPYPDKLYKSLEQLYKLGILDTDAYLKSKKNINDKYGPNTLI
ncbi:hypothetical protein [Sporosarcina sp.]|uniref:hypothetical protein n=1 Tax=Sporosarcina sp. TaxID=49982 RepID=UPI002629EA8A|nr:hypothetical protein [Sporosarcina sp.]